VRYVGHAKDVPARVAEHWKHRHHEGRLRENPRLYGWLSEFLICPPHRVLAAVPYEDRYQREREWTVRLAASSDLFNISFGAAPLHRPPLTAEHKAKISRSLLARRGGARSPAAAA
jgi:hypothetical protein